MKTYKVEITPKTTLISITILLGIWLLIQLRSLVLLVFIAYSIAAMISPLIEALNKKKIPKSVSILVIYFLFLGTIIAIIALMYKPFATQMQDFITVIPDLVGNALNKLVERVPALDGKFDWDQVVDGFTITDGSGISSGILSGFGTAFGIVGSFFSGLVNVLSTIVLSIYFIHFRESSKQTILRFLPKKHHKSTYGFINKVETQLGRWLRAQLFLMFFIGFLSWLGLEIIDIKFALPMGIIGGLLEAIPNVGPTISLVLALMIGIGSGAATWKLIFIIVWFIAIQQLENYVIVPKLMQKFVGTNPVLTLIAILGGSKLLGLWGALLAVPTVAIIQISLQYYLDRKKISAEQEALIEDKG